MPQLPLKGVPLSYWSFLRYFHLLQQCTLTSACHFISPCSYNAITPAFHSIVKNVSLLTSGNLTILHTFVLHPLHPAPPPTNRFTHRNLIRILHAHQSRNAIAIHRTNLILLLQNGISAQSAMHPLHLFEFEFLPHVIHQRRSTPFAHRPLERTDLEPRLISVGPRAAHADSVPPLAMLDHSFAHFPVNGIEGVRIAFYFAGVLVLFAKSARAILGD
mmetsp:Transcript_25826/g.44103  ORF Transcript_25826/g.44103 Transcript_25826/m.44103 type:complete len:217 (+) Transcript_25826:126-776(+)